MPKPTYPTLKDGREIAENNAYRVLRAVYQFGHLRRQEIAMAGWPKSKPDSAYIMACRTIKKLLDEGHLKEKINSFGQTSFFLTTSGANCLTNHPANSAGVKYAPNSNVESTAPQFYHRTLGSCYLLDKARQYVGQGVLVYPELQLGRDKSPLKKEYAREKLKKLPDGLVLYPESMNEFAPGIRQADWIEVESARKEYEDICNAFKLFTENSWLNAESTLEVRHLVFVCDTRTNNERMVLRHLEQFLKEATEKNPNIDPDYIRNLVYIARCSVDIPFAWRGFTEHSAADIYKERRKSKAVSLDVDEESQDEAYSPE